jgi:hypothetical protein
MTNYELLIVIIRLECLFTRKQDFFKLMRAVTQEVL